jgi:hypothetical protein
MDKKLDLEKVELALRRAARSAVTGSKEVRSGQVMVREAASGRLMNKGSPPKRPSHKNSK